MYQDVCVHGLNKGNKRQELVLLRREDQVCGRCWSRLKNFNCYFIDEAARVRSNLNIDMLWDLLGCAIVFYIQPCTDSFIGAMQQAYLRGVGNLSLYQRVCNFSYDCWLILRSEGPSSFCSAGSVETVTCSVHTV